uniref:Sulfotransferase n=1 Tax=Branchiostoma floridae TaxID=7739 RepID=C3XWB4_BRAFL|eukprot:XP_002611638.1 hypothetical protein BRAFLDRAFT_63697 [Branchiostoma floridae]
MRHGKRNTGPYVTRSGDMFDMDRAGRIVRACRPYHRLPKCGSRAMKVLIAQLQEKNHFKFFSAANLHAKALHGEDLLRFAQMMDKLPTPSIYEKHTYFIDFPLMAAKQPLYINLVRDPIERRVSAYYYLRYGRHGNEFADILKLRRTEEQRNQTLDYCVANNLRECSASEPNSFILTQYFCGQSTICTKPSQVAVEVAKENIRRHYAVVGVLEEFSSFLKVLEVVMPQFFRGAVTEWEHIGSNYEAKPASIQARVEHVQDQQPLTIWPGSNHSYYKVFYNRLPKCGSTSVKILIRELKEKNGFKFFEDKDYEIQVLSGRNLTFDECVFNNLWECNASGAKRFLMTQFFCGQDSICMEPSQAAVEKAKENIRRHYAVVGVLEEFSSFLKVLEMVMPQFFRGAHDTWRGIASAHKKYAAATQNWTGHVQDQKTLNIWPCFNHNYSMAKLVYNRVPKCGSNSVVTIIRKLKDRNGFHFFEDKTYTAYTVLRGRNLTFDDCVFYNTWECNAKGPLVFMMTKFFCGHDDICMQPTQAAVEKAKENIRRHYAVVGVLEEFSSFLKVLEVVMPQFFRGAHDTWREIGSKLMKMQKTSNKRPASEKAREVMRERLHLDYQVYDFIKERFHRQKSQLGIKD